MATMGTTKSTLFSVFYSEFVLISTLFYFICPTDELLVPGFGQVGYVEDCEKKGNHLSSDRNPHFLAVWAMFDTFYLQIFCKKKKGEIHYQRKTFISE
jgi:hypothetical protein